MKPLFIPKTLLNAFIDTVLPQKSTLALLCSIFLYMCNLLHADTLYLNKEYLSSQTVFGKDTVFRSYHYNNRGFLTTIIDSPLCNDLHPTFTAQCDSLGRIIKVQTFRKTPSLTSVYTWVDEHTLLFGIKDTNGVLQDSGRITICGKLRAIRLPQMESMLPTILEKERIVTIADSAQVFDKEGLLNTTYYWEFNNNGTDTVWYYRLATGNKREWVNSYTIKYTSTDVLYRRFPAMDGCPAISFFFSETPVGVVTFLPWYHHNKTTIPQFKNPAEHIIRYRADGRKVPYKKNETAAFQFLITRNGQTIERIARNNLPNYFPPLSE